MTGKQKIMLCRIGASALLFVCGLLLKKSNIAWYVAVNFLAYLVAGYDVLLRAVRNILHGQIFDENFLMTIASIGAILTGELNEGVAVMILYQIGEFFQSYAVGRSRDSIAHLMDIRPDSANIERNGVLESVDPEDVGIGDIIVVKPGEKVPLDGIVTEGRSTLNTSALTGESLPRSIGEGEEIFSGCINLSGLLRIRVTKEFGESTVSKILDLVENATEKKAKSENFITRFARVYTPSVVIGAVLLAVIPPLFFQGKWNEWIYRALCFLVISCPCALVISVPLSFFGGIGAASKSGILVKGSSYLETLAKAETLVFDKTGTLTEGTFKVTEINPKSGISKEEIVRIAALAESYSDHPIAASLREAAGLAPDYDKTAVENVEEIAGHGVKATVEAHEVAVGNTKLMEQYQIAYEPCLAPGTHVHVCIDGEYAGSIVISDCIKSTAKSAMASLRTLGVKRLVMLTGDSGAVGERVAKELGLDEAVCELLPTQKVECVERLLAEKNPKSTLAFVGDGVNDAPVLARADTGIAMGAMGSDAAIEAADVVLMDDDPAKIADAIRISRGTLKIVHENIVFALGVKLLILVLGALGLTGMWTAIFADVGVAMLAILNAMRALRLGRKHS